MNQQCFIKFHAEHTLEIACTESEISELAKWRSELRREGLVGQDPERYGGFGFGNLSKKHIKNTHLITGSQTGHLDKLTPNEFAKIIGFDIAKNLVRSSGMSQPSSETMTHLAVYKNHPEAGYVFHVHCPEIWLARQELKIPTTDLSAMCGSVEMFYEVQLLLEDRNNYQKGILAMGGHIDGIIAWGQTADEVGFKLLSILHNRAASGIM